MIRALGWFLLLGFWTPSYAAIATGFVDLIGVAFLVSATLLWTAYEILIEGRED